MMPDLLEHIDIGQ